MLSRLKLCSCACLALGALAAAPPVLGLGRQEAMPSPASGIAGMTDVARQPRPKAVSGEVARLAWGLGRGGKNYAAIMVEPIAAGRHASRLEPARASAMDTLAPPPEPSRPTSYVLFFDRDQATFSDLSKRVIETIAADWGDSNSAFRLTVFGDRGGPEAPRRQLVARRIGSLRAALIANGVEPVRISVASVHGQ